MQRWPADDDNTPFDALLQACITEGPQIVTRGEAEVAVLVPIQLWRKLNAASRPSLKALLTEPNASHELAIPPRDRTRPRRRRPDQPS